MEALESTLTQLNAKIAQRLLGDLAVPAGKKTAVRKCLTACRNADQDMYQLLRRLKIAITQGNQHLLERFEQFYVLVKCSLAN